MNTIFTYPAAYATQGDWSLLTALNADGGGINALSRQAAAAYLNSVNVSYPLSTAQVKAMVDGALNGSLNMSTVRTTLDGYNNLHNASICPN